MSIPLRNWSNHEKLRVGGYKIASIPVMADVRTLSGVTNDREINLFLRGEVIFERESPAAARYRCPAGYTQDIPVSSKPGSVIVDFSQPDYDTHKAVTKGKEWKFKAPKAGIYTVTAYVCCSQGGDKDAAGGTAVCLHKNGSNGVAVYLAQLNPSIISNTMLGGTTDIALEENDTIDVRVHAFGKAKDARVGSANALWICIRYVGSAVRPDR